MTPRHHLRHLIVGFLITMPAVACAQPETLIYHDIKTDASGKIIPWSHDNPGKAYDHVMDLVWNFWDTMRVDMNGIPYYMNHQVWMPGYNDPRGLGGDQIQMAMSAWQLYYAYSGNERVKENMKFMADYYLTHGLSSPTGAWPHIPYPYNTLIYSGIYDGDMVIGKGYTQPDKAGSFGYELIKLYKMVRNEHYPNTSHQRYLDAATKIATTLARHITSGDVNSSPLPFKVHAETGEVGSLLSNSRDRSDAGLSSYTTNWSGTMDLFLELRELDPSQTALYQKAFDTLLAWMRTYPMVNNKWGPFFEDIPGWSDTQINAMTWARFIMTHRSLFPEWKTDVQKIIDWVYKTLANESWKKYGVIVIDEQTAYRNPGNSHSSRQAADELLFGSLTGNTTTKQRSILQLNWATYMVDSDGKNKYYHDENWLTDGYGDYVRHYLRAMAAAPELAPFDENHLLSSSSIIQLIGYHNNVSVYMIPGVRNADNSKVMVYYRAYGNDGTEMLRLTQKPSVVLLNGKPLSESKNYQWQPVKEGGGILTINRQNGNEIVITR